MKISIVTLSFNQAPFLEDAICSVIRQKGCDIEYILVDPGSTDGSREIIQKYRSSLSKILFEPDRGPADGLNKGFSLATGDVFGYLNADDMLQPNALFRVVRLFRQNPSVDVLFGNGVVINEEGLVKRRCFSDSFTLISAAYGAAVVIQPSTFFRKASFLRTGGFNVANTSNWDGELFIDMALNGAKVKRTADCLSAYRISSGSITGSGRMAQRHFEHGQKMFLKIRGREKKPYDAFFSLLFRVRKHLFHPIQTIERLRFGAIFQSGKET